MSNPLAGIGGDRGPPEIMSGGGGAFGFMNRFQVVRSVWHLDVMSTYIMDNAMVGSSFTRDFTIVMCHCSTDVKVVSRVHFDLTNNKFDLNVQDTSDNPTAYTIQLGAFKAVSTFVSRKRRTSHTQAVTVLYPY